MHPDFIESFLQDWHFTFIPFLQNMQVNFQWLLSSVRNSLHLVSFSVIFFHFLLLFALFILIFRKNPIAFELASFNLQSSSSGHMTSVFFRLYFSAKCPLRTIDAKHDVFWYMISTLYSVSWMFCGVNADSTIRKVINERVRERVFRRWKVSIKQFHLMRSPYLFIGGTGNELCNPRKNLVDGCTRWHVWFFPSGHTFGSYRESHSRYAIFRCTVNSIPLHIVSKVRKRLALSKCFAQVILLKVNAALHTVSNSWC